MLIFFMKKYFFTLAFIYFFCSEFVLSKEITTQSIIKIQNKIPFECGIKFMSENKNFEAILSVKKEDLGTKTFFMVSSKLFQIDKVKFLSDRTNLANLKNLKRTLSGNNFILEGQTDIDKTTEFIQKVIINGGELIINDIKYIIPGPIDSKVRLEYLFCTGEMFRQYN